jgi:23S rRNA pseudouridine1911/1915/1917 synthase
LVFTRTWAAKKKLSAQFRFHRARRRYLAIAQGRVKSGTIRSEIADDRGDGIRGSRKGGRPAITHVEALEHFANATLVPCTLETGRTHQIRIHLSEAGHPIAGERVYVRGYEGPTVRAPRLMLHAAELEFEHPDSDACVHFEDPPPSDFEAVLRALREK